LSEVKSIQIYTSQVIARSDRYIYAMGGYVYPVAKNQPQVHAENVQFSPPA